MNNTLVLIKNSIVIRTLSILVSIASSFYTMPLLINGFGTRLFGYWSLLSLFIGYFGFIDLGLSQAVVKFVSAALGKKDIEEQNVIINSSIVTFAVIGSLSLIACLIVGFLSPYFISDQSEALLFRNCILLMGAAFSTGFIFRSFEGCLHAKIRIDLLSLLHIILSLLRVVLIAVIVKFNYSMVALAAFVSVLMLVEYLAIYFIFKLEFSTYVFSFTKVKIPLIKEMFRYGSIAFIVELANLIRFRIDPVVISSRLGIESVTYYSVPSRMIEYFNQLILGINTGLMQIFSTHSSKNESSEIERKLLLSAEVSTVITAIAAGGLLLTVKAFIIRWIGSDFADTSVLLWILLPPFAISLGQLPLNSALYGTSNHSIVAKLNWGEALLNLAISLVLVKPMGLAGVALGTAIPLSVKNFYFPYVTSKRLNIPIIALAIKSWFLPTVKAWSICLLLVVVLQKYVQPNYFSIVFFVSIYFLVASCILFFIFGQEIKILLLSFIRNIFQVRLHAE